MHPCRTKPATLASLIFLFVTLLSTGFSNLVTISYPYPASGPISDAPVVMIPYGTTPQSNWVNISYSDDQALKEFCSWWGLGNCYFDPVTYTIYTEEFFPGHILTIDFYDTIDTKAYFDLYVGGDVWFGNGGYYGSSIRNTFVANNILTVGNIYVSPTEARAVDFIQSYDFSAGTGSATPHLDAINSVLNAIKVEAGLTAAEQSAIDNGKALRIVNSAGDVLEYRYLGNSMSETEFQAYQNIASGFSAIANMFYMVYVFDGALVIITHH
jgi:hypothetical protein